MQKPTEAVKEKFVPKQQTKTSSPSRELARWVALGIEEEAF
jgi:hypothetical protein